MPIRSSLDALGKVPTPAELDDPTGITSRRSPYAILYISRSLIDPGEAEDVINNLVIAAQLRNAEQSISGALVFTGRHFAQLIEGDRVLVEQLMTEIFIDRRHTAIRVLRAGHEPARRFEGWGLAYRGFSPLVDAIVARALLSDPASFERRVRDLVQFMARFTVRSARDSIGLEV